MDDFRFLDWDSEFFGFPVAHIQTAHLTLDQLAQVLGELEQRGARLVYWPSASAASTLDDSPARQLGGVLVARKATYSLDLTHFDPNPRSDSVSNDVQPFSETMGRQGILALAIDAGRCSRFATDPNITDEQFQGLYTRWIERSLAKELADEVLVIHRQLIIVGMTTLVAEDGHGDIGLFAIDSAFQRQGLGTQLVSAAKSWFRDHGCATCRVVTQQDNEPACRLYERCGYQLEKIESFYHFWLNESGPSV